MRESGAVGWLVASVVLSVILTVFLNVLIRMFPDASRRAARRLDEATTHRATGGSGDDSGVRVIVPWKAMILVSLFLTIAINVVLRLA